MSIRRSAFPARQLLLPLSMAQLKGVLKVHLKGYIMGPLVSYAPSLFLLNRESSCSLWALAYNSKALVAAPVVMI